MQPQWNHQGPQLARGRPKHQDQSGGIKRKTRPAIAGYEDVGQGYEPRNMGREV